MMEMRKDLVKKKKILLKYNWEVFRSDNFLKKLFVKLINMLYIRYKFY